MPRWFNIGGPCIPYDHYMIPPERRLGEIMKLIDQGKYFTLHAGRQTGKTTCAQWLVDHYNAGSELTALWVDVETAKEEPEPEKAFKTLLNNLDDAIREALPDMAPPAERARMLDDPATCLLRYLRDVTARCPRPLVVFFDEADCLVGKTMVSFLTQLRAGYLARSGAPFPRSIVLIGASRDYPLGTSSPFNIGAEAKTLAPFTRDEVAELVAQHTQETGQRFEPEAVAAINDLSMGHPWLVNALADQITRRDVEDRSVSITAAHVESAKETIILERRTHIDSLVAKLREPRVRRVIDPMLAGEQTAGDVLDDDLAYVLGLGLIVERNRRYVVANSIYREVIPRALTHLRQMQIEQETAWYLRPGGALDMQKLMAEWQTFWRKDGHLAAEGFDYRESGPHLMLMAFLQRIVNGGGRIDREYGLGRGALDLMITFGGERHAIEVKLRRRTETEKEALEQVARYLDTLGLTEGWLVMFDLRKKLPWSKRLTTRTKKVNKKRITIVGC